MLIKITACNVFACDAILNHLKNNSLVRCYVTPTTCITVYQDNKITLETKSFDFLTFTFTLEKCGVLVEAIELAKLIENITSEESLFVLSVVS